MLRFLSIRHLAVIDHLEVEFEPGLNILTGETGAGKSILVEAIDLLVGGRATADLVRTGETQATIQAIFERADGTDVIVRREVSAQGRSRAFIDDTLATSTALRDLGASLLDLHGQHEHQALLDPIEHVGLLDAAGDYADAIGLVAARFEEWRAAGAALDRTRLDDREKKARIDIASFHLHEIDAVNPTEGEDESLGVERTRLANADKLNRLSTDAYAALYEGDAAALATLGIVWKRVAELAALDPRFTPFLDQRDEIKPRLEELAYQLRASAVELDDAPGRLQAVEDRLAALERVKRKHGPTLRDVFAHRQALREELDALDASADRMASLDAAERTTRAAFLDAAGQLSTERRAAASRLGHALEQTMADLAMPKSRFEIRLTDLTSSPDRWTSSGTDDVEFFCSTNPGEDVRPLARIVSGGELSRIMLALRTLPVGEPDARTATAFERPARTLIFDEVDAGIGGAAADAVGQRLQRLGRHGQVLCITHLPQIAARADAHFQIAKSVRSGRTVTSLTRLDDSGREGEIARMIAGAGVTATVLASAREMLHTRQSEIKAKGESETKSTVKAKGKRRGA